MTDRTDADYIREGVRLADDFDIDEYEDPKPGDSELFCIEGTFSTCIYADWVPQWFLDALAAQLVRQVDATVDQVLQHKPKVTTDAQKKRARKAARRQSLVPCNRNEQQT